MGPPLVIIKKMQTSVNSKNHTKSYHYLANLLTRNHQKELRESKQSEIFKEKLESEFQPFETQIAQISTLLEKGVKVFEKPANESIEKSPKNKRYSNKSLIFKESPRQSLLNIQKLTHKSFVYWITTKYAKEHFSNEKEVSQFFQQKTVTDFIEKIDQKDVENGINEIKKMIIHEIQLKSPNNKPIPKPSCLTQVRKTKEFTPNLVKLRQNKSAPRIAKFQPTFEQSKDKIFDDVDNNPFELKTERKQYKNSTQKFVKFLKEKRFDDKFDECTHKFTKTMNFFRGVPMDRRFSTPLKSQRPSIIKQTILLHLISRIFKILIHFYFIASCGFIDSQFHINVIYQENNFF